MKWMAFGGLLATYLSVVTVVQAAPLRMLPDLSEIGIYEQTAAVTRVAFPAGFGPLLERRPDPLGDSNRDFGFKANENYDAFYSDAYGTFDPDGGFLTVEGVWRQPSFAVGSMNINEVELKFGGVNPRTQFGDYVSSFVVGSVRSQTFPGNYTPGSEARAVDHNLATTPVLGQTSSTDLNDRFRLTIGFNDISARTTQFTIDSAQSYLAMEGLIEELVPIGEQSPGSLQAAITGSITANLLGVSGAWTDIGLPTSNASQFVPNAGTFQPGGTPADLAFTIDLSSEEGPFTVFATYSNSVIRVSSSFTPIGEGGAFSLADANLQASTTFSYLVPGLPQGSSRETQRGLLGGQGSLQQIGNTLYLTIPIDLMIQDETSGLMVDYHYTGQIVASAQVPEPSSLALVSLGCVGLIATTVLRRARRSARASLCCLLVGTLVGLPAASRAESLTVMSFNVRIASKDDGPNNWFNPAAPADARRLKVFDVIQSAAPDIIGMQECEPQQIADLNGQYQAGEGILDYDYYAANTGISQYLPIFYRHDRFTRVDQGFFWLSATPDVPYSIYPGAASPRLAVWLILDELVTGQRYFVLNTHLDHVSADARTFGATLIDSKLQELSQGLPILVTGDFNASETTSVLKAFTAPTASGSTTLVDGYRLVHPVRQLTEATVNGWVGLTAGARVDFVLSSADLITETASIIRTSYDGRYPSDHYPVTVTFDVAAVPEPSTLVLATLGVLVCCQRYQRRVC